MADVDLIGHARARHAELLVQKAQAERQYAELEETLRLLGRNLDAMHGGIQELEALLAVVGGIEAHTSPPALLEGF